MYGSVRRQDYGLRSKSSKGLRIQPHSTTAPYKRTLSQLTGTRTIMAEKQFEQVQLANKPMLLIQCTAYSSP